MRARLEYRRSPESAFPRENPRHQAGARDACAYFDFRLDVRREPLIHSPPRILDLHDALTVRVLLRRTHQAEKKDEREREREGKEERNNEEAIPVRTDPLGANDITRPRNDKFPLRYTHFPPPRDSAGSLRGSLLSGSFFPPPPRSRGTADLRRATPRARGRRAFLHETRRFRRRVSSRVHTSERTRRGEAKRGRDPSGWRCESPNALRACGFRYPGLSGEDKKASLERC